MEFIAYMLIPVSLPEFITGSGHIMIQITGRIFYCRYRRIERHQNWNGLCHWNTVKRRGLDWAGFNVPPNTL